MDGMLWFIVIVGACGLGLMYWSGRDDDDD